jgi:hypothetical protein
MGARVGRGVSGKRGLGSGSDSHKTSTSKPAKGADMPKTSGSAKGGKSGGKVKY